MERCDARATGWSLPTYEKPCARSRLYTLTHGSSIRRYPGPEPVGYIVTGINITSLDVSIGRIAHTVVGSGRTIAVVDPALAVLTRKIRWRC